MVPPYSHRISRVRRYSGYCLLLRLFTYMTLTFFGVPSHALQLKLRIHFAVLTPHVFLLTVWPLSLSLATTHEISFDFSSSPYLDVSVQAVPLIYLFYSVYDIQTSSVWIAPFGHLCISVCLRLHTAFRS